jgi:hypothetical protein
MLLASEDRGPGHAQPFFLLEKLRQESKFKNEVILKVF